MPIDGRRERSRFFRPECEIRFVKRDCTAQRFETSSVKNLQTGHMLDSRRGCCDAQRDMATCPKCMGALTEHHRCPPIIFRRASHTLSTAAIGSGLGAMACYVIEERPAGALLMAAAALGAVVAVAVRQAAGTRL